jgi:Do/DeqQ family serine protease
MRISRALIPALALTAACSNPNGESQAQTGQFRDPAPFQESRRVPLDAGDVKTSFAPVARRAGPAVVNVLTIQQQARNPWFELFGGQAPRQTQQGGAFRPTGSGVIVRPDGVIVTNNHVVENATQVRISLADRREFDARVLLRDPRADLAVLKIDAGNERLPTLNIDIGEQPEVGDLVLAVGNPFGVGQTVTQGIVSATQRTEAGDINQIGSLIQTDAAINPGNSGGALVDMDGDLIGINTAILSRSGTSSGVGFAVPAVVVRQVVDQAAGGATRVVRPYLGVGSTELTAAVAESLGLTRSDGVLVASVTPGSPAARAGVREGDVIQTVNGRPVVDPGALNFQIATARPGDVLSLQVRRGGRTETVRARLEAPPELPRLQRTLAGPHPLDGATVANISADIVDRVGLNPLDVVEGVIVVSPGRSIAARSGFRAGDIVRAVNGRTVRTVQDADAAMNGGRGWRITILRGGRELTGDFAV